MSPPTAIITGGASGIGLALTRHLQAKSWAVVIADLNPPPASANLPPDQTLFIETDTSSWDSQAALFRQAYEWQRRLDFFAGNAGIDDRDDIFNSISGDATKPPRRPNMKTFDVNLIGVYYGLKLAAHYMSVPSREAGKASAGGKIVVTASAAGLYRSPFAPQYAATKHALVGLVRAVGETAKTRAGITVNAVCPALVKTGLAPPGLLEQFAEDRFTPMGTILRAFDELALFDGVRSEGWTQRGRTGQTVEGNLGQLIWHTAPNEEEESNHGEAAWGNIYTERNRRFAMEDWEGK